VAYIPDYCRPCLEITDNSVANIEGACDTLPNSSLRSQILHFDPKPDYMQFLHPAGCQLHSQRPVEGKYDALYSTSRGYLDIILSDCGCDLGFHTYRDVLFGGGMPEPKENSSWS